MSDVVISALAGADAAALQVELLVSIPALSSKDFSHLARVDKSVVLLTGKKNSALGLTVLPDLPSEK